MRLDGEIDQIEVECMNFTLRLNKENDNPNHNKPKMNMLRAHGCDDQEVESDAETPQKEREEPARTKVRANNPAYRKAKEKRLD